MVVPYIQGLGEKFKRTCNKQGIQGSFSRTGAHILTVPEEYIGESGRTFGNRYKEHLKASSPIHQHTRTTGHLVSLDHFSIVQREFPRLNQEHQGSHAH